MQEHVNQWRNDCIYLGTLSSYFSFFWVEAAPALSKHLLEYIARSSAPTQVHNSPSHPSSPPAQSYSPDAPRAFSITAYTARPVTNSYIYTSRACEERQSAIERLPERLKDRLGQRAESQSKSRNANILPIGVSQRHAVLQIAIVQTGNSRKTFTSNRFLPTHQVDWLYLSVRPTEPTPAVS